MKKYLANTWSSPWFRLSLVQLLVTPAIVTITLNLVQWLSLPAQWRIYNGPTWGGRFGEGIIVALYLVPVIWLVGWVAAAFRSRPAIPREITPGKVA